MFSIEHEFDSSTIVLVDEGNQPLQEDVTINAFEDCVVIEQMDPRTGRIQQITFSQRQVSELSAALDLPEGIYKTVRKK